MPMATLQNDLIGGEGGMVSAEPAHSLQRLARLAARRPALSSLEHREHRRRFGPSSKATGLREAVAYLAKFGDRTVNELKLESLTLHDDPLPLFRAIGALARQIAARLARRRQRAFAGAGPRGCARACRARARRASVRRLVFGWVLRQARAGSATARTCASSGRGCSRASAASFSSSAAASTRRSARRRARRLLPRGR